VKPFTYLHSSPFLNQGFQEQACGATASVAPAIHSLLGCSHRQGEPFDIDFKAHFLLAIFSKYKL